MDNARRLVYNAKSELEKFNRATTWLWWPTYADATLSPIHSLIDINGLFSGAEHRSILLEKQMSKIIIK